MIRSPGSWSFELKVLKKPTQAHARYYFYRGLSNLALFKTAFEKSLKEEKELKKLKNKHNNEKDKSEYLFKQRSTKLKAMRDEFYKLTESDDVDASEMQKKAEHIKKCEDKLMAW